MKKGQPDSWERQRKRKCWLFEKMRLPRVAESSLFIHVFSSKK
jgi:hypothetical protein